MRQLVVRSNKIKKSAFVQANSADKSKSQGLHKSTPLSFVIFKYHEDITTTSSRQRRSIDSACEKQGQLDEKFTKRKRYKNSSDVWNEKRLQKGRFCLVSAK
jgi:hypothetical protein